MATYRAYHKVLIEPNMGICFTDIPGIAEAKAGFWINEEMEYTQGSDCKWWIPPAQILYVDKITDERFLRKTVRTTRAGIEQAEDQYTYGQRGPDPRATREREWNANDPLNEDGYDFTKAQPNPYPGVGTGRGCGFLSGGSMSDGQITCNNPLCKDCYPDSPPQIPTSGPFC